MSMFHAMRPGMACGPASLPQVPHIGTLTPRELACHAGAHFPLRMPSVPFSERVGLGFSPWPRFCFALSLLSRIVALVYHAPLYLTFLVLLY